MCCFRTRPKATASVGLEHRALLQPSTAVPSHLEASDLQLPLDAWSAVETVVLLKKCCNMGRDGSVLLGTLTRVALPLLSGVEVAEGHTQLAAEPGKGKAIM